MCVKLKDYSTETLEHARERLMHLVEIELDTIQYLTKQANEILIELAKRRTGTPKKTNQP